MYHVLPRAARAPSGLLRLRLHQGSQELLSFLVSEGEVGVGVQTENSWPVDSRKALDVRDVIVHLARYHLKKKRNFWSALKLHRPKPLAWPVDSQKNFGCT